MDLDRFLLAIVFLLGSATLSGFTTVLQRLGRLQAKEEIGRAPHLFFFRYFLTVFFGSQKWPGLLLTLQFSRQILQLCYGIAAFFFLLFQSPFDHALSSGKWDGLWISLIIALVVMIALVLDFLVNLAAVAKPKPCFRILAPLTSSFLLLCAPLTLFFLKILKSFLPALAHERSSSQKSRERISEILADSELSPYLDPVDQKSILSLLSFKDRIAREVMVPRIDVFSLPADTTLQEASQHFLKERYSRIPIYRENVDHIVGVLLYKDVLSTYARAAHQPEPAALLNRPIENLVKPVLYTPETKKIAHLLQEFRHKQIHLAIIVDEYGGTEGIVTIEDILEELVGEIADEYDIDEELLYSSLPTGGWIVDARMTIIDIEEELGVRIPQSGEYDTIGGYVFHRAGSIPAQGWRLHHDDFDLEVLSSDERSIGKIRITPHSPLVEEKTFQ